MVYQFESAIARRAVLKGACSVALFNMAISLRSLTEVVKANESVLKTETKCPVCQSLHEENNCSGFLKEQLDA
jgi:hypothetical protein